MAIKVRHELTGGLYTGINTKHIMMSSKMVCLISITVSGFCLVDIFNFDLRFFIIILQS